MQQKKTILICAVNINSNLIREMEDKNLNVIIIENNLYDNFVKRQPAVIMADVADSEVFEDFKEIKKISDIPFIVYTEKNDLVYKLIAFETGADDYILKDWDIKETVARICAVVRRCYRKRKNEEMLVFEGLMINKTSYEVMENGEKIDFPPKEFELLYCLAETSGKVFTREQLLDRIWGFDYYGDTRTVDVHIDRIRKKLKRDVIKTVYGVGYKFEIS